MDKVRKLNIQSIQAQSTSSCCLSVPLGAVLFLDLSYQAFLLLIASLRTVALSDPECCRGGRGVVRRV